MESLSPFLETSKEPEWLQDALLAVAICTRVRELLPSDAAVAVTSIASNAEGLRVNMDVRITPVLERVHLNMVAEEEPDAENR